MFTCEITETADLNIKKIVYKNNMVSSETEQSPKDI